MGKAGIKQGEEVVNRLVDPPGIRMAVQVMACIACGSEANATCTCGVAYKPKSVRATEAVKAHPEKSDRALAEEIGVGRSTIQRARQSGGPCGPPERESPERVGRDGKNYPTTAKPRPIPPKPRTVESNPVGAIKEQIKTLFLELDYEHRGEVLDDLDRIYVEEGADRE
jgi:hypothetical protein